MPELRSEDAIIAAWKGDPAAPVVSICCLTYNHEPYIAQALDGMLMQETKYPYEILVHDDASTDRTPEIIREYEKRYPQIIRSTYQTENQKSIYTCGMNPRFNYSRAKGSYIAICDGDDYWTDPRKLQNQVDFLEANPEYGLVHTDNKVEDPLTGSKIVRRKAEICRQAEDDRLFPVLLMRNCITTSTVLVRTNVMRKALDYIAEHLDPGLMMDYTQWLAVSLQAMIKHMPDITAVYRLYGGSTSRPGIRASKYRYIQKVHSIRRRFCELTDCSTNIRNTLDRNFYHKQLFYAFVLKDPQTAKEAYNKLKALDGKTSLRSIMKYIGSYGGAIHWILMKLFREEI